MNVAKQKELLQRIEILEWEKAELHKNYVNAQKEVATSIYHSCIELAKGQGDVVYTVDFYDVFSPYGVEVAEEHKLNREELED